MSLTPSRLAELRQTYSSNLLESTIPFWLRHGLDREQGGLLTGLGEDGTVIDTDKAVWLQGRAAWTFATLYNTIERRPEWLAASKHCLDFIRDHCRGPAGKLYFTVTRDGRPLRMRRYVYSECFAAIGSAAYAQATGDGRAAAEALQYFETYLHHSFTPGVMPPKTDPVTRPMKGVAPHMIAIVTAQEIRSLLGDVVVRGASCTQWIDRSLTEIERDFFKPDLGALMEVVGPDGAVLDHFDGRTLNPGHALECAWFILHEAKHRGADARLLRLGLAILDCMWARGWDREFGGLLYFTDLKGLPVQEYWAEMKFWWPHNEAEIATLLAYQLSGDAKYAAWHTLVHDWSHRVFADPVHGEWFGYAHRDGRVSTRLKGNTWKGPFHLPRMQWYCGRLAGELLAAK
ncbi:AGE family epimerase/isomerase [Horticoccus sp. 23ND18S-11]|uniref:AGE family epimerase/isomerase n=1 Tax=Horticoccus sp. 23ND18S-11 TaxID=3391832 RepID=UPI0039C959CF